MIRAPIELSLPMGYRFFPSKKDIFNHYLRLSPDERRLESRHSIVQIEIYGENKEPWRLFDGEARCHYWVYTTVPRQGHNRRRAGCGKCEIASEIIVVKDESQQILGGNRYSKFVCEETNGHILCVGNGTWVMHEFSLQDEPTDVLCCIYKKEFFKSLSLDLN